MLHPSYLLHVSVVSEAQGGHLERLRGLSSQVHAGSSKTDGTEMPTRLTGVKKTGMYQNIGLKWDQNPTESISVDFLSKIHSVGLLEKGNFF